MTDTPSLFDAGPAPDLRLDGKVATPTRWGPRLDAAGAGPRRRDPDQPTLAGLEAPYESPLTRRAPTVDRIEDVTQRIAPFERDGRFRCDAVTHLLVLVLYRQFELSLDLGQGRLCHPGLTDDELTEAYEDGIKCLRSLHGEGLFPDQPVWRPVALRRWTDLWHGVDLIGRAGRLDEDVVALAFQGAANMTGKQRDQGAFFTPFSLCRMLAEMNVGTHPRPWTQTTLDPCAGAGSMLV